MSHIASLEQALAMAKSQNALCETEVKTLKAHILGSNNNDNNQPPTTVADPGRIRAPAPILPGAPGSCSPSTASTFHAFKVCSSWFEGLEAKSAALPITLVTQLSVDRLPSLRRLLDSWQAARPTGTVLTPHVYDGVIHRRRQSPRRCTYHSSMLSSKRFGTL